MNRPKHYYMRLAYANRELKRAFLLKDLEEASKDFYTFCWGGDGVCRRYGASFLKKMTSEERGIFDQKLDRRDKAHLRLRDFEQFKE